MSKPGETYEVTVISREDVTTFPKLGEALIVRQISYVGAGLPPATVTIEKGVWDPELEKKTIREDLERRLKQKVETFRV